MDEIMKADVFFFVTTIAVALIALGSTVALIFLIVILGKIKRLMDRLETEADALFDDLGDLREGVRSKAHLAGRFLEAFSVASILKRMTDFVRSRRGSHSGSDDATNGSADESEEMGDEGESAEGEEEDRDANRYQ